MLVHNLEHGWTIVWYDETSPTTSCRAMIEATADKFDDVRRATRSTTSSSRRGRTTTASRMPDGKQIAFTHWSVHQPEYDPEFYEAEGRGRVLGCRACYCDTFSGAALDDFMQSYPYDDAPEGYLWH